MSVSSAPIATSTGTANVTTDGSTTSPAVTKLLPPISSVPGDKCDAKYNLVYTCGYSSIKKADIIVQCSNGIITYVSDCAVDAAVPGSGVFCAYWDYKLNGDAALNLYLPYCIDGPAPTGVKQNATIVLSTGRVVVPLANANANGNSKPGSSSGVSHFVSAVKSIRIIDCDWLAIAASFNPSSAPFRGAAATSTAFLEDPITLLSSSSSCAETAKISPIPATAAAVATFLRTLEALKDMFVVRPAILSKPPKTVNAFLDDLTEVAGPFFIVLDEIGKAFRSGDDSQ
ncbi:hypothetical protein HDU81_006741 [Chytriomyces hyalinus]|nr:hypothetical protein HDU81_006741 [Chytriomyces hyalinus]